MIGRSSLPRPASLGRFVSLLTTLFVLFLLFPSVYCSVDRTCLGGLWSNPLSWQPSGLPQQLDNVLIPSGIQVLYDLAENSTESRASLGYIRILQGGSMFFEDGAASSPPLFLSVETLMVEGYLEFGRPGSLFTRELKIELVNHLPPLPRHQDRGASPVLQFDALSRSYPSGKKMIAVVGSGEWSAHAVGRLPTWTKLAENVQIGDSSIRLETSSPINWRVGDEIFITSSDYSELQTERRFITAIQFVAGSSPYTLVQLSRPLQFNHIGRSMLEYGWTVDMRAEVGVLTSNVLIYGEMARSPNRSEPYYEALGWADAMQYGAHTIFFHNSFVRLEGLAFRHVGQGSRLARYPIHWHIRGDGRGQYAKRCVVYDSFSKGITVHSTNELLIQENIIFNVYGHAVYIEDGDEELNEFIRNLVVSSIPYGKLVKAVGVYKYPDPSCTDVDPGLLLQAEDTNPSGFWIVNINNTFVGNVAVGHEWGFWVRNSYMFNEPPFWYQVYGSRCPNPSAGEAKPELCCQPPVPEERFDQNQRGIIFVNNVAHSNRQAGWWIKENTTPKTNGFNDTELMIDGFLTYRNPNGIENYGHGNIKMSHIIAVDNTRAVANDHNRVGKFLLSDSLFIGESTNFGSPTVTVGALKPLGVQATRCSGIFPGQLRTLRMDNLKVGGLKISGGHNVLDNIIFANWLPMCGFSNSSGFFNYGNWHAGWLVPNNEDGRPDQRFSRIFFDQTTQSLVPGESDSNRLIADPNHPRYLAGWLDADGSQPCSVAGSHWLYNTVNATAQNCEYRENVNMWVCPPNPTGPPSHVHFFLYQRLGYSHGGVISSFTFEWECGKIYKSAGRKALARTDRLTQITPNAWPITTNDGDQFGIFFSPGPLGHRVDLAMAIPGVFNVQLRVYKANNPATAVPMNFTLDLCRDGFTYIRFSVLSPYEYPLDALESDLGQNLVFTRQSSRSCPNLGLNEAPWKNELFLPPGQAADYCNKPTITSSWKDHSSCEAVKSMKPPADHGIGKFPRPEPPVRFLSFQTRAFPVGFNYSMLAVPQSPQPQPGQSSSDSGLVLGLSTMMSGIVIGGAGAFLIVLIAIFLTIRRRRNTKAKFTSLSTWNKATPSPFHNRNNTKIIQLNPLNNDI